MHPHFSAGTAWKRNWNSSEYPCVSKCGIWGCACVWVNRVWDSSTEKPVLIIKEGGKEDHI